MLAVLLWACTSTEPPAEPPSPPPPPRVPPRNAVVIVIDTLRADALVAAHTPRLDALAASGFQSPQAWSAGTWTVPSVISLFTGMSVRQHGFDLPSARIGKYPRIPEVPTLASVLQAEGFGTFGLYSNGYLAEELGFDRGFDSWRRSADKAMPKQWRKHVDKVWSAPDAPRQLAYLHLLGPHSPLRPSDATKAKYQVAEEWFDDRLGFEIGVPKRNRRDGAREQYRAAYHAVIEDTDARVGELLDALGDHAADTLVVVTSDHGELLGEHNVVGHGTHVWQPLTRVPYFAGPASALPPVLPGPCTSNSTLADLVTDALGVSHAWPVQVDTAPPLVSQRQGQVAFSADCRSTTLRKDDAWRAYDLQADPGEETPLADPSAGSAAYAAWAASVPAGTPDMEGVSLHPDTLEQLRVLGYME
jgi:arylsulfatase A-like enzyme